MSRQRNMAQMKGCQGAGIKDTWTKPKWGRIKGGRWGQLGLGGRLIGRKMKTSILEQQ